MKICMLTNTYLPHVGGVARSVHSFVTEYRRAGHETLVVAPSFADGAPLDPEEEEIVERVPAIQNFNGSDFSVRLPLGPMLSPRLLAFDADIYHSHHPFLLGDTALRAAADRDAPILFTHHTLYEEYTHYVPFQSPAMREFAIELSTRYANLCDAVIAPSESIAALIADRGVTRPIEVIPTGICIEQFARGNGRRARRELGISEAAFVVGHVGRLAPEKNLTFLSAAVALFLQNHAEAVFLVVGSGPSEPEMRAEFKRHGLESRLYLAGKRTGTDLADAYRAMDVFAFSSFSETQGMVLAEAMAAGLPVVALDASGVREVVVDDRDGFLLPADAAARSFAERLGELRKRPELVERFAAEARSTAARFSREASAAKALNLYARSVARYERRRRHEDRGPLDALLHRIQMEWTLWTDRAEAVVHAFLDTDRTRPPPSQPDPP
jgi:1,2-diacylglycerol 3-alpha-glucosyltransferase